MSIQSNPQLSGLNSICEAGSLIDIDPNSLVERLELLILETKAGHDGSYNEMLNISKQLLSMNIINHYYYYFEQLDNFVFNYGKKIMVEKQQGATEAKQQLLSNEVFSPKKNKI